MAVKYAILGTAMNWSAHTWGQKQTGADYTTKVLTPAAAYWDTHSDWTTNALAGLYVEIAQTATSASVLCTVASNTARTLTVNETGPSNGAAARWILFNESDPTNSDTANLNAATVTMDVTTVPDTGTLAELHSKTSVTTPVNSAGSLTIANALGSCAINATTITGAATVALISCALATGNTLTVNGNIYGANHYQCGVITMTSTGNLVLQTGNVTGGTGNDSYGIFKTTAGGTITTNGNLTAGSNRTTNAVYMHGVGTLNINSAVLTGGSGSGNTYLPFAVNAIFQGNTVNFTNCHFVAGVLNCCYAGPYSSLTNTGNAYYMQPVYNGAKYGPEPADHEMLAGVVCGDSTGNYHEATVAEVQDGVFFGPASSYEGTYAGGGVGRPELRGGNL